MKELSDGQILLRPFRAEDVSALYEAVRESIVELSRWMPWCHADYGVEEAAAFVTSRGEEMENGGEHSFAIVDAETGKFLGAVGLNQFNRENQRCNLGYWVRTSSTGRGVASTATRLAARYGLYELGLHRVEIIAATGNLPSRRAAEKAGALREGVLRKRLMLGGKPHDAVIYSLVAEDFG